MDVMLDNVWASPSTLHGRVTVWGPGRRWRHRYDVAVPLAEIPVEAVQAMWQGMVEDWHREDLDDLTLF